MAEFAFAHLRLMTDGDGNDNRRLKIRWFPRNSITRLPS